MEFVDHVPSEKSSTGSVALVDVLLRVSQLVRLRFSDWLAQYELNDVRYGLLAALADAGEIGCSQSELAERLFQSESNVSTLIERMQKDGLVLRLRSEADRRKRVILISPAGRESLVRVDAARPDLSSQILNGVNDDEGLVLHELLRRMGARLEQEQDLIPRRRSLMNSEKRVAMNGTESGPDPTADPMSPQFALRQMLLELSLSAASESMEKGAA